MVKIHLLNESYIQKPSKKEITCISQRITENETEIGIEEFAKEVGEKGKPFTPALFYGSRKSENFLSQQVYALDFDETINLTDFWKRANEYQVIPAFIYATYRHTEQNQRFRTVFINDCEINNPEAAKMLICLLMQLFPEADKNCIDLARMFFGGKRLLYLNSKAEINIKNVAIGVQAFTKVTDPRNYGRNINGIGEKLGIAVKENLLCIYDAYELGEFEEKGFTSNNIIIGMNQDSSKYKVILHTQTRPDRIRQKKSISQIQHKTLDDLLKICPLMQDFWEQDIPHEHKFLLASNLLYIKGGKKIFFDGLKEHAVEWEIRWDYFVKNEYLPQSCKRGNCPYVNKCNCKNLVEKVSRKVQKTGEEEEYISLDKASQILRDSLHMSLAQQERRIYLIQAQTSLGKTTAYCEIAEKETMNKPLMFVVPTNKLQKEVYKNLTMRGVEVYATPDVKALLHKVGLEDLEEKIKLMYDKGYSHKVKGVIRKYIKENNSLSILHRLQLEEYLASNEELDGKKCIVTTHARFLTMKKEILEMYEIIIDEDILMTLFKNSASISFDEINEILYRAEFSAEICQRLDSIMKLPDGCIEWSGLRRLLYGELDKLYEKELNVTASIADFMASDIIYVDQYQKQVHFLGMKKLPDVKMIIVSATLNEKLYRDCFENRNISYMKVPAVKYKGKLKQYIAYSMSRSFIAQVGIERIRNSINRITKIPSVNEITFKKVRKNGDIYFGKTEGFNQYQGQNLVVLGTPHNVPFIYKMIGKYLNYDIRKDLNVKRVEYNGCSFKIMTFEDVDMRNLQFYFLESELEQAIGRARLLRFDCTVYLFSNFPCKQAEIIQEDYLELENLSNHLLTEDTE